MAQKFDIWTHADSTVQRAVDESAALTASGLTEARVLEEWIRGRGYFDDDGGLYRITHHFAITGAI